MSPQTQETILCMSAFLIGIGSGFMIILMLWHYFTVIRPAEALLRATEFQFWLWVDANPPIVCQAEEIFYEDEEEEELFRED